MINNVLWWPQNKNTQNVENIVRSHVTVLQFFKFISL